MLFGALFGNKSTITEFTTVDQLKQAILEKWNKLLQHFIYRSIDEWRCCLTNVVQQQGGHIEHI